MISQSVSKWSRNDLKLGTNRCKSASLLRNIWLRTVWAFVVPYGSPVDEDLEERHSNLSRTKVLFCFLFFFGGGSLFCC